MLLFVSLSFFDFSLSATTLSTIFWTVQVGDGKGHREVSWVHRDYFMKITDVVHTTCGYKDSMLLTVGAFLSS